MAQPVLAKLAGIGLTALRSLENGRDVRLSNYEAVERALVEKGVEFDPDGVNVRLTRISPPADRA